MKDTASARKGVLVAPMKNSWPWVVNIILFAPCSRFRTPRLFIRNSYHSMEI
ncbi:hypothetical protein [Desulforapulum autotrophicum]|uniref:hypothetical protein n=1 Tax=Desulforapulum autotrophicum TaxID=2296 RepID=UPI001E610216|nr:hypothetical protein [Desulforapulum autotrophicum]